MKDSRGFTLLELLMVVIIIAILASIALPQYLRTAERSRAGEALTLLASIRSSQQWFNAQNPATGFAVAGQECQMDIDIPGSGCVGAPPGSAIWDLTGAGGAGGSINAGGSAVAGRIGQPATIMINLTSGVTCATGTIGAQLASDVFGLAPGPC